MGWHYNEELAAYYCPDCHSKYIIGKEFYKGIPDYNEFVQEFWSGDHDFEPMEELLNYGDQDD